MATKVGLFVDFCDGPGIGREARLEHQRVFRVFERGGLVRERTGQRQRIWFSRTARVA